MLSAPPGYGKRKSGEAGERSESSRASLDEIGVAVFTLVYAPPPFAASGDI